MAKMITVEFTIRCTARQPLDAETEKQMAENPEAVRQDLAEGILSSSRAAADGFTNEIMGVEVDMPKVIDL